LINVFAVSAFAANPSIIIKDNDYYKVITQKNYAIAPGISEARIVLNDETGNNQNMAYVMEVDLSNPYASVLPAYKDMDPYCDGTQGLSKMAKAAEEKLGVNVVGGTNIYLTWANNIPVGVLVINGKVYYNDTNTSYGYLAVTKDGKAEFRDGRTPLKGDEWQAITVCSYIVKNGVSLYPTPDHANANRAPRTTIGMKADGTLVMAVVDGRQAPTSVGMTMYELAQMMLDLGCVTAFNCDGGGSSTFISEREGSGELTIKNSPSDGVERPTLTSLLVISTATPSGVFDHANLSPNGDFYTPGSEIQFTAVGVDSAGGSAPLPANIKWRLAAESSEMGSIDESTGLFTGYPGKTGKVTVELISDGAVIGTTSIEIVVPDTISFFNNEISLDFGAITKFNLMVKYQGMDINYRESDIVWTMSDPRLGSFSGSTFTASDNETVSGSITATYAYDETISSTINVVVGMLPIVVLDFEDYVDPVTGEVIPAKEYYTIDQGPGSKFITSNYGQGGKQSAEIVSIDDDEPVRMGRYAMKLNYDFTNCGAVTEGAELGFSEDVEVPGMPTGIGVWVYAPEGTGIKWEGDGTTAGFWLRAYLLNKNGVVEQANFTLEPKAVTGDQQPGIYWEGWKYCEADLTQLKNGPYKLQAGKTFRLMYVHGIKMGTKTAGSIYFDNLQFVYGTNIDDLDKPVINQRRVIIEGMDTEFFDGMTIPTNVIDQLWFSFFDVENKYTSGIDAETSRIYIDGVNICNDSYYNTYIDPNGSIYAYNLVLQNGWHTITVSTRDKAGNEQSETYTFLIQGDGLDIPAISVEPEESSANLGGEVNLNISASTDTVDQCSIGIKLSALFPNYSIDFADGYEGTYKYNKLTKTLMLSAVRTEGAMPGSTKIATVTVDVPTTLKLGDGFSYSVASCSYAVGGSKHTWSQGVRTLPVDAAFRIAVDPIILGFPGYIEVTENGVPAAGIDIYLDNGTLIGTTDENGVLSTYYFSTTAGEYSVYAKDASGRLSFRYKVCSYAPKGDANGVPFGIMNNASADGSTQKNITWLSNPVAAVQQKLQYTAGDSENWIEVEAATVNRTFTRDGYSIVAVNNVTLTNLTPGATYRYRVGADGVWSEIRSFTTCDTDGTSFFVIADIQTKNLTEITQLMQIINAQGFDFGIQTGDAVDNAASYGDWMDIVQLFGVGSLADTDVVHVLGNHEYAGDATAAAAASIFGLPVEGVGTYYSVTYGEVYVAVINYTSTKAELAEALEWLKRDAAGSNAAWKILTMHQPPYYTNISGGNAEINAMVPDAVEEAGIDFVFSGHDHSYARTKPLRDGEINEEHGVVYFICGSTGEKSYTVTDNPDFHFDKIVDDYGSVYLSVSADKTSCRINVIESGTYNGVIDSYEKTVYRCEDGDHTYSYDRLSDILTCSVCGYECDASNTLYSGWAYDSETGGLMNFSGGKYLTGYQYISSTAYYFDNRGIAYNGEHIICRETCLFVNGVYAGCLNDEVLLAGWCGENVEFVIYKNGTLLVEGYGPTYNYDNHGTRPFANQLTSVRKVEIGPEITRIGRYMFAHLRAQEVTFAPGSKLKSIGTGAFYSMSNLVKVILPEGLEYMGALAFGKNPFLIGVVIPDTVTSIDPTSFRDCDYGRLVIYAHPESYAASFAKMNGIMWEDELIVKNGIIEEGGKLYYYVNDVRTPAGLIKLGDDYYYARSSGELAIGLYWVSKTNGLLAEGYYMFADDGKMVLRNGIIEEGGKLYYYVNDVRTPAGLIKIGDDYYYARSNGELATGLYWVSRTNGLFAEGYYMFGDDGKMIINESEADPDKSEADQDEPGADPDESKADPEGPEVNPEGTEADSHKHS